MADQGMTPEEKLLRIIESPGQAPSRSLPRVARANIAASGFLIKSWVAHYRTYWKSAVNLKTANQVVLTLCLLITGYLFVDFWLGLPNAGMVNRLERAARQIDIGNISIEALNPLALYLREIGQNNVFSLPEPPPPKPAQQEPTASEALKNMVSTFRVVGIIWSDAPQAIIEDTKEGRTYFLNRGSRLKEVRVKEILRDRVILSYDNQEIELR